jgi:Glycosyltransferase (GlcNAc)
MEETIFIQIAAYRDPELIPTVKDCIAKAAKPERLHFCIGWQHTEEERIDEIKDLPNIKIVDVHYLDTKGACWIRRKIQDQYNGETYTLQLDSHHRFIQDWDEECIKMLKSLKNKKVKKPLLTAYLTSYEPSNDPDGRLHAPWQINYDRFMPEGPVFLRPSELKNWEQLVAPAPARGLSAHFIFTYGKWCKEVPYDPELYFHGEEISLAVRSYTHGYDLFHPHKILMWHQYTRAGQKKHWDDSKNWDELNKISYKRVKILFGVDGEDPKQIDFKECGFGKVRTVQDFERYAGVEFKTRRFHKNTIAEILPPINCTTEEQFQSELCNRFKYCIDVYKPEFAENDYDFWCVVFKDKDNKDLYRKDADVSEIHTVMNSDANDKFIHIWREFDTDVKPAKWTIWPHSKSKEWNTKVIENTINYL